MTDIRFRAEGDLLVLQVCAQKARSHESYAYYERVSGYEWRDANVTDLLEIGQWLERQKGRHEWTTTEIPQEQA